MGSLKGQPFFSRRWHWGLCGIVVTGVALTVGIFQVSAAFRSGATSDGNPTSDPSESATSRGGSSARRVRVTRVFTRDASETAVYPGTVRAARLANLAFRVGGPLNEVNIGPGDVVHRGAVLMRIDPRDFKNTVTATQSELDAATARLQAMKRGAREEDLELLKAKLEAAEARRHFLESVYDRNKRLIESNGISRQEYDSSESELVATRANIRALKQELRKAERGARAEDIEAMEAEIRGLTSSLETARDSLEDTTLRAPFDGIVTTQLTENFEQVKPGQRVLVMHDISSLEIDVDLPAKEVLYRSFDDSFVATVQFLSVEQREFQAQFKEVSTDADSSTRTYKVTFVMQAPPEVNVLPGMIANVGVESRAGQNGREKKTLVPAAAVQSNQSGTPFVWVVSHDGSVERRDVTLGNLSAGNCYEVVRGVVDREPVVTAGSAFLYDGVQVIVVNPSALPRENGLTQVTSPDRVN